MMKIFIKKYKIIQIIGLTIWCFSVIIIGIFLRNGYHAFRKNLNNFYSTELHGKIADLIKEEKGFYLIVVRQDSENREYRLPNFNQYIESVSINDSVYKKASSYNMYIFSNQGLPIKEITIDY